MAVNYQCDFCKYTTIHKAKFSRHVATSKHIIGEVGLECCGITYYDKHQWVNHKRSLKHHHRVVCGETPKDSERIEELLKSYKSPIVEVSQKSIHLLPKEPRPVPVYEVEEKATKTKLQKLLHPEAEKPTESASTPQQSSSSTDSSTPTPTDSATPSTEPTTESKPAKAPKEPKTPKEPKEPKAPKEPKEPKEPKAPKEPKEPKEPKAPKEPKEPKALKENKSKVSKEATGVEVSTPTTSASTESTQTPTESTQTPTESTSVPAPTPAPAEPEPAKEPPKQALKLSKKPKATLVV